MKNLRILISYHYYLQQTLQNLHQLCRLCIDSVQTLCRLRNTLCRLCVDPLTPNGLCKLFVALNYCFQTLYRPKIPLCRIFVDLYCPVQTMSRSKLAMIWCLCRLCVDLYCSLQTLGRSQIVLCRPCLDLYSLYRLCVDTKSFCVDPVLSQNCSVYTLNQPACVDSVQTINHSVQTLYGPQIFLCRFCVDLKTLCRLCVDQN